MTKSDSPIRGWKTTTIRLLFIAATLLVYFAGLTLPLVGPDEPRYAQVAREMFERGDWVTPTLGGFNWFEKPALLYWLQIAFYNLFGVSEFSARFGSALFGIGVIVGLWILGRHIEKETKIDDPRSTIGFADLLALVAASTAGIMAFAHGASFDIILTFPITAAMVSYFIYDLREQSRYLIGFYFFMGLAVLAKGLVGIVFPIAIVAFYHMLMWKLPSRSLLISFFWGTLLSAGITCAWYVPMYARNGYEFIDQFFIQHHFQRYTSNKYLHPQPFYFFFWVLPLMTIPWMPFFIAALWNLCKRAFATGHEDSSPVPRSLLAFALSWLAVPMVFFSFSGSKLPGYILPAVPAAIILIAEYVYRFMRESSLRRTLILALSAGTFALVLVAILAFAPTFAETDSVKGLFTAARERGVDDLPVLMLHGLSHNAEFYAPGRITRDSDGKQRKYFGPPEIRRFMQQNGGGPVLVLVPVEYMKPFMDGEGIDSDLIKDNGEWALVLVRKV